jgi:hypothetical protein
MGKLSVPRYIYPERSSSSSAGTAEVMPRALARKRVVKSGFAHVHLESMNQRCTWFTTLPAYGVRADWLKG